MLRLRSETIVEIVVVNVCSACVLLYHRCRVVHEFLKILHVSVSVEAAKPRSVNVALETVFEFEKTSDIDFLNNIQNFISKVKEVIEKNPDPSTSSRRKQQYKFTDFLENLINNLNTFNDNILKEVIQTIDTEIRKEKHTDALQIKELLLNTLDGVNIKSARSIRKHFDNLLRKLKSIDNDKDNYFLGFINMLYKNDSERKLTNFIRKLKILRRSHRRSKDLQNTIRKAVQSIIFDHFSKLSDDTKIMVESQIRDYLNNYLRDNINENSLEYERNKVKIKLTKLKNYVGKTISRHKPVKRKEKIINIPKVYYVIKNIKRDRINKTLIINTIGVKSNPIIKSTHITLYPEILDKRKMANFEATNLVPSYTRKPKETMDSYKLSYRNKAIEPYDSIKLKGAKYENIPEDALALSSISQSAEINVNFISDRDETNDLYRPMKIRASSYKTKNHRTTKSNKRFKYDIKHHKTKTEEFYSTPETSVEHFGSLYKSKAPKMNTERSSSGYIINKLELNKQNDETLIDKSDEKNIYKTANEIKRHTNATDNTERSITDKQLTITEATSEKHKVSKLGWYRRVNSFNESKYVTTKINNNDIRRREPKETVVTNENFDISKLLQWYRRAKTDGLKKYENITENRNSKVNERNTSFTKNITPDLTSKNVDITKSDFRRANKFSRSKVDKIGFPTKFENISIINNTKNNLYNYETMTEKMQSTIREKVSNFTESDIVNEIVTNITEFKRDGNENYRKSFSDVTKNTEAILKRDSTQNVTFETKTTNQVNSSFDVKSYIKNSDIKNIEDDKKRKEIERKMKQDLDKLFASPITNATTEAYTDIFEALDDAFDLSPLK